MRNMKLKGELVEGNMGGEVLKGELRVVIIDFSIPV